MKRWPSGTQQNILLACLSLANLAVQQLHVSTAPVLGHAVHAQAGRGVSLLCVWCNATPLESSTSCLLSLN